VSGDRIIISDLHLRGILGINDWERQHRQDIMINVVLEVDTRAAAASDDIEDSLNYRTLTKTIATLVDGSSFQLIEALAEAIARLCVCEFGAATARVRVEKPGALRFARSVGVEIERGADDFS